MLERLWLGALRWAGEAQRGGRWMAEPGRESAPVLADVAGEGFVEAEALQKQGGVDGSHSLGMGFCA